LRWLYEECNGSMGAVIIFDLELLSANSAREEMLQCRRAFEAGAYEANWHRSWVPVLSNGGGDYILVDAAPDGRPIGEVLRFDHESPFDGPPAFTPRSIIESSAR